MPIYTFYDEADDMSEETWDKICSWEAKKAYLADNPTVKEIIGAPATIKGTGDHTKPPDGFKEVLQRIGEANPTSKLGSDYGPKDYKSVEKRKVMDKHRKAIIGED